MNNKYVDSKYYVGSLISGPISLRKHMTCYKLSPPIPTSLFAIDLALFV